MLVKFSDTWKSQFVSGIALFSVSVFSFATVAHGQAIVLQGQEGGITLSGDLLEYSNGVYKIRTALGEFNIDEATVDCQGEACPEINHESTDFSIAGSDTIGDELMPLLVRGQSEQNGHVVASAAGPEDSQMIYRAIAEEGLGETVFSVQIEDQGSSTGFQALLDGTAQIAMSSRRIKRKEVEAMRNAGLGDPLDFSQEHEIALDGLLLAVNPSNPVNGLNESQITSVLSGAITNWSEIGGEDIPITVYSRDEHSGTYSTIAARFLDPKGLTMVGSAITLDNNNDMSNAIFNDRSAFGYVGFGYKKDTKPLDIVLDCGISVRPSEFSARTGEYPLQRTLYLYTTHAELPENARKLISYASSHEADGVIKKSGFISFEIGSDSQEVAAANMRAHIDNVNSPSEANLMRELFIDMTDWERLSTTFHFKTGSSVLDNHSQRDLIRMVEYLEGLPDGTEVSLVGYTDSDGNFEANRALSVGRAAALEEQVFSVALRSDLQHVNISLKGFGELNPVGCNDDFAGQRMNRRVEVWVRN